ncbi:3423_t:CDS:2 [Ambispora gerdemannii]|uniref:3423_t:CDS:1 n=1 Tax=Ambispora gerdemannii TaxID=144530 RepID=A0A9N9A111_9GLOM|nr:3423_t:CDS:2 [Ambispora gerdemannii]
MYTTNEVVKKWKRADVPEYLKSKQDEMDLDDEDIKLISLSEEKLLVPPYNLLGSAGAIALLIKALNGEVQGKMHELWDCHYTNGQASMSINVSKDRVDHSFKKEIEVLRKLFADEHPA